MVFIEENFVLSDFEASFIPNSNVLTKILLHMIEFVQAFW